MQGTPATATPNYCHDTVTLLPETLPLAAGTLNCTAAIVISQASSLLVYGAGVLTTDALQRRLGINSSIVVGQHDAFKASNSGAAGCLS